MKPFICAARRASERSRHERRRRLSSNWQAHGTNERSQAQSAMPALRLAPCAACCHALAMPYIPYKGAPVCLSTTMCAATCICSRGFQTPAPTTWKIGRGDNSAHLAPRNNLRCTLYSNTGSSSPCGRHAPAAVHRYQTRQLRPRSSDSRFKALTRTSEPFYSAMSHSTSCRHTHTQFSRTHSTRTHAIAYVTVSQDWPASPLPVQAAFSCLQERRDAV